MRIIHRVAPFFVASYIAVGETNPVMVLSRTLASWDTIQVLHDYTGFHYGTSISAYNDTVICAYEHDFGILYNVSYSGGNTWNYGTFTTSEGMGLLNPDVTCRGGKGSAIVFDHEVSGGVDDFDPVWFLYRDHYSPGPWDAMIAQVNDKDSATAWPNRIQWLPSKAGGSSYSIIYISWDPDAGTPYFTRLESKKISLPAIYFLLLDE